MIQLDQLEIIGHDVRQILQSASIYWQIMFFVVSNQFWHTVGRLDVCVAKWHSMASLLGFSNWASLTTRCPATQAKGTQTRLTALKTISTALYLRLQPHAPLCVQSIYVCVRQAIIC
jgi:hypothetical protein